MLRVFDTGHMYLAYPKRQGGVAETPDPPAKTLAHVVTGSFKRRSTEESRKVGTHKRTPTDQTTGYPTLVDDLVNTFAPPPTGVE